MKKKKIAILTQPLGLNYGGMMQNYALQGILSEMGFEPLTINRDYNKDSRWITCKVKIYNFIHKIESKNIPLEVKKFAAKYNNDFVKRKINITKPISSNIYITDFFRNNDFDCYIVGSDQTWRPQYSPKIENYFLDFLNGKKGNSKCIAYASSFGTDEWEYSPEKTEKVKVLVKQFDAISVREDSGIELCEKHLDTKAELVLDPTLLLTAEDYIKDLRLKDYAGDKFLFTYVLDKNVAKLNYIDKCASKLGLKVKSSQSEKDIFKYKKSDVIADYLQPPIEEWLSGFKNADFVITDSFHGMVFSILFRKPFVAIVNKERGTSRFTSLLKQLNLLDRLVFSVDSIPNEILDTSIDYEVVHKELEQLKNKSLAFLKQNLS